MINASTDPILSIAVPTYKRPEKLSCLLDSIACQYSPGMPLEILVSDNSEDSRTAELIKSYNLILPINYIQQSQNIGACNNYIYSVSASKGSYCWILGDDDLIAQGSIARLLRILTLEPDIPALLLDILTKTKKVGLKFYPIFAIKMLPLLSCLISSL